MRKLCYVNEDGYTIYTKFTLESVECIFRDNEYLQARSLLADRLIETIEEINEFATLNNRPGIVKLCEDAIGKKKYSCPHNVGGHTIGIIYGELITEYDVDQGRSIDEMVPFKFCKECGAENAKR